MGNTYLVGISGPPRSGKDTLARLAQTHFLKYGTPTEVLSLSLPMRLSVYALLGLTYSDDFRAEHDVFEETFSECLWIHLQREGKTFEGDSRSYVGEGYKVSNNRTPEVAADRIIGRIEQQGWKL